MTELYIDSILLHILACTGGSFEFVDFFHVFRKYKMIAHNSVKKSYVLSVG